ncbi:MAG: hypothetical protein KIS30_04805 [Thermoplasmata archaeon]|nr:hypothetical protein [Candidatus Sysuiplasma acidicola]MBX8646060.1 hypothetical protein [Candidatus Sysuiplasma acidicola]MDH2905331.1 hypothetical protein [Methanomassiliicoccales archaeon]
MNSDALQAFLRDRQYLPNSYRIKARGRLHHASIEEQYLYPRVNATVASKAVDLGIATKKLHETN